MDKTKHFLKIFKAAKKHYENDTKRLAGQGWQHSWQTLIATIMSAQTRDETTIPIADDLFAKYDLKGLANATPQDIKKVIHSINYNKNKSIYINETAKILLEKYDGEVPKDMDEMLKLPGVGRKTANLVLGECFNIPSICVDVHVHKICNELDIVNTKTPTQTEMQLRKIAPKDTWIEINRYFVLWGKDVYSRKKEDLLNKIGLTL